MGNNNNIQSNLVNLQEVALNKKILKLKDERDTYKLAFENLIEYLKLYAHHENNGSLLLGATLHASDLDEDDNIQLNAFMLIEEAIGGKIEQEESVHDH